MLKINKLMRKCVPVPGTVYLVCYSNNANTRLMNNEQQSQYRMVRNLF